MGIIKQSVEKDIQSQQNKITEQKSKYEQALEKYNTDIQDNEVKEAVKQIIAEKFMAPRISAASNDLEDYKFFCFNGEPKYCQVIRDRHTKETIHFVFVKCFSHCLTLTLLYLE